MNILKVTLIPVCNSLFSLLMCNCQLFSFSLMFQMKQCQIQNVLCITLANAVHETIICRTELNRNRVMEDDATNKCIT